MVRADRGTENSEIAFIHSTLRSVHSDEFAGEKSFRYGRSTSNQVLFEINATLIVPVWNFLLEN